MIICWWAFVLLQRVPFSREVPLLNSTLRLSLKMFWLQVLGRWLFGDIDSAFRFPRY